MDNTEPGGIPREQAGRPIQNKEIIVHNKKNIFLKIFVMKQISNFNIEL